MHSCKRRALCASLAMHSTTSPVLRCNNKHYSRLMLIGIALFRLHAQGRRGQRTTQVHRCGTVSARKVSINLASVAPRRVRAIWLWFERQTCCNQAACVYILAWLCVTKSRRALLLTALGKKYSPSSQQVVSEIAQDGHSSST